MRRGQRRGYDATGPLGDTQPEEAKAAREWLYEVSRPNGGLVLPRIRRHLTTRDDDGPMSFRQVEGAPGLTWSKTGLGRIAVLLNATFTRREAVANEGPRQRPEAPIRITRLIRGRNTSQSNRNFRGILSEIYLPATSTAHA